MIAMARCPSALRGEHHLFDARRAVEHRVLGVVVQVDEALSHQPRLFL